MILQLSNAAYTIEQFVAEFRASAIHCAACISPALSKDCLETEYGCAVYKTWLKLTNDTDMASTKYTGWIVKHIAYEILCGLKRDLREFKHLAIIEADAADHVNGFDIENYSIIAHNESDNMDYLPHAKDTKLADVRMDFAQAVKAVEAKCAGNPTRLRHLNDILKGEPDGTASCKAVLDMFAEELANYKPQDNKPRTRKGSFTPKPTTKNKYKNDLPALKAALLSMGKDKLGEVQALIDQSPSAKQDTLLFPYILAQTPYRQITRETGIRSGQVWQTIRRISLIGAKVRGEEVCHLNTNYNTETAMKRLQKNPTPELMVALMKTAKDMVDSVKRYHDRTYKRVVAVQKQLALLSVIMTDISHAEMKRIANMTDMEYKSARIHIMARLKKHITLA